MELVFILAAVAPLWFAVFLSRQQLAMWRSAMVSQHLTDIVTSAFLVDATLTGLSGALRVRMSRYKRTEEEGTRIRVDAPGRPLAGVLVRTEGVTSDFERLNRAAEIEIGDEPFDAAFYIGGPPALVHAVLDEETRRLLLTRLHACGPLEIENGVLTVEVRQGGKDLSKALGAALEAAHCLPASVDIAQRLADNARHDPKPLVRLRNLLLLTREFGERSVTRETLEAACSDPYPEVRLRAATALGAEHVDIVLAIAEGASVDDTSAASAVYALGQQLSVDRALALLDHALRTRRLGSAHACLERLGRSADPSVVGILAKVLTIEEGELATHAARALAGTGAAAAEPPLVAALDRDLDVRQAAAEALGRCGSVTAVLPLKDAAEQYVERDFRRAARQAVAAIQSRAAGATPGQLSLSAADAGGAGQLSLAEGEAGRLSLADSDAGQLSFPRNEAGGISLVNPKRKRKS
jgi:HEAT repeat protein